MRRVMVVVNPGSIRSGSVAETEGRRIVSDWSKCSVNGGSYREARPRPLVVADCLCLDVENEAEARPERPEKRHSLSGGGRVAGG